MEKNLQKSIIDEFYRYRQGTEVVSILEAALFLEDTFKVSLSDEEINSSNLGSAEQALALIQQKINNKVVN